MIDPIFPGTAEGREKRGGLKPKKSLFLNSLRFLQKVGRGVRHLLLGACFQYLFLGLRERRDKEATTHYFQCYLEIISDLSLLVGCSTVELNVRFRSFIQVKVV